MKSEYPASTRRTFLATTAGAAAALTLAGRAGAAEPTDLEKANEKVVNDFCAAWATRDAEKITGHLAEEAVFRMTESRPPVTGRETIRGQFAAFLGNATKAEFEVLRSHVMGDIVINERIDRFVTPERTLEFRIVGVFFVRDGKIQEWSDYTITGVA